MSQHAERERAVRQARKLMEMTSSAGASEAEAEFAFKRLNEIKETFDLSLDDIILETLDYKSVALKATAVKNCPMKKLVTSIGQFTDTKVWRTPGEQKMVYARGKWGRQGHYKWVPSDVSEYNFFGVDSDVEMASYVYKVIYSALVMEEVKFKKTSEYRSQNVRGQKRVAINCFRQGFLDRMTNTLWKMTRERNQNEKQARSTGSDLVLNKEGIRDRKFEEQLGIKLKSAKSYARGSYSNSSAYTAGSSAAKNVNLNRPMNGSSDGVKMIGSR